MTRMTGCRWHDPEVLYPTIENFMPSPNALYNFVNFLHTEVLNWFTASISPIGNSFLFVRKYFPNMIRQGMVHVPTEPPLFECKHRLRNEDQKFCI